MKLLNFVKNKLMKKDNNTELLPLVNEAGEVIGCATRGECHDGTKLLHPVVHLHLFDSAGRLYLQAVSICSTARCGKPYSLASGIPQLAGISTMARMSPLH